MPVVPRYGPLKVDLNPLPGVRKSAADTAASLGAGVDEAAGALGGEAAQIATAKIAQMTAFERQRADDTALVNAKTQLANWETDRLYNPDSGALAQKGQAALGLPEQIDQEFSTVADGIAGNLNDRQRLQFQKIRGEAQVNVHATIQRHVFGEIQSYQTSELNARVDSGTSLAIANANDPRRVGVELGSVLDDVRKAAPQLGLGPEALQAQLDKITTKVHAGVIDRLLANDQAPAAQIYYEETKSAISGDAQAAIEKALEEGTLRKQSQGEADKILAAGGTPTDMRAKVRGIDDAKLRDEVQQRVEHELSINAEAARAADEARLNQAYATVDQTGDVRSIKPADWVALGDRQPGVRAYAEARAKGTPIATDVPTWYARLQEASTDPDTFKDRNLLDDKTKLDTGDFKQLAELQNSIRNGERQKADQLLAGFRTHEQIINGSLTSYGLDPGAKPNTPQGKANAALYRIVDQGVANLEAQTGKKATNEDIQSLVDHTLATNTTTPGSWWALVPGSGVPLGQFTTKSRGAINMTVADIPAATRVGLERQLRAAGRAVSDATVLDLYQRGLVRINH